VAEKYYSILTNRGKELEAEAIASGIAVIIQDFVIGDGHGQVVTPDPQGTTLVNEVYRGTISDLSVSPEQSNQFIAHLVIPATTGGFTAREAGLLTDKGELYSVANLAAIEKPESGINVNLQYRLAVSETADIELKVATGDGLFLRQDANLGDVKDNVAARRNIGLGDIATHDAREFVPVTGGDVAWLDNASHYSTKEGAWPGGGAFQGQLADRRALFYSAGYSAGGNVYLPMTKATVQTTGTGYQAAISYGVLVSGRNDFPSGCIHILDDQRRDHTWLFNPNDNSFTANGSIRAGASVYAGGAIFEPGGNINGEIWGGWLSTWLANQFTARDNNINTRATWDWANGQLAARDDNINTRSTWDWVNQRIGEVQSWTLQNFVSSVQLGAVISTWWPAAGGDAPAGYVLTGGDFNEDQSYVRYKPVQFWTRGGWVNAQG
jgi:hypothetical protein